MFRPRLIPVLLLRNNALVKSVRFKKHKYIGDPINAVRLYNNFYADELIFLDIDATKQHRCISCDFIKRVGEEADMPFGVGGGINSIKQIKTILAAGAEKVIIGAYAATNPMFINNAAHEFGSSTITVCIDVKTNYLGKEFVWINNGSKNTGLDPLTFSKKIEELGAGEIIIQSITNDGTMGGYDLILTKKIAQATSIPVVALGGAGSNSHFKEAYISAMATGIAAGSMFVFQGSKKGVLINYPRNKEFIYNTVGE